MSIEAYILNATHQLDQVSDLLANWLHAYAPKIAATLELHSLDITVSPFESGAAPKSGIGAYMLSPHRIEILVDTDSQDLANIIKSELPSVLAHEMHHCARSHIVPKETTLAENILTEGLACHFEQQFNGGRTPSLFDDISTTPWEALFEHVRPHLRDSEFSFDYWFLGEKPDEVPKYAGYWIGYNLVISYAQDHGLGYKHLVGLESEDLFLPKRAAST